MINQIHHGDCVSLMAQLPEGSIDLTVTSPPYDGLRTYNGYSFDFEAVAAELYRVTKPGGVVVWVVGDATVKGSETGTSFRQALHFMALGFNLHDTMIYASEKPPQTLRRYEQKFEYMFIFSKGRPQVFNGLRSPTIHQGVIKPTSRLRSEAGNLVPCNLSRAIPATKLRGNIWTYATGNGSASDKIAFQHPAIFPEKLAADHILSWSNPGDTVLDPFSGSSTTAKMAMLNGRKYIGCEVSEEYVRLSQKRLAALQPVLLY